MVGKEWTPWHERQAHGKYKFAKTSSVEHATLANNSKQQSQPNMSKTNHNVSSKRMSYNQDKSSSVTSIRQTCQASQLNTRMAQQHCNPTMEAPSSVMLQADTSMLNTKCHL